MYSAALIAARSAWTESLSSRLRHGAHIVLLTEDETESIVGRRGGFELRDTLAIMLPGETRFGFLFRKPLAEGGVLDQMQTTATGILNIDVSRITSEEPNPSIARRETSRRTGTAPITGRKAAVAQAQGRIERRGSAEVYMEHRPSEHLGRWPANVVLVHGAACRLLGERQIDGHTGYPNGPGGSSVQFSQKGTKTTRREAWAGHADADGKETIPVWACQANCPALLLDQQSGILTSGQFDQASRKAENTVYGKFYRYEDPKQYAFNSGGASRFYPQFSDPAEFISWIHNLLTSPGGSLLEEL